MGHKEPPEVIKLQKLNWDNFMAWCKKHGTMVMPIPKRAVIYAGFPEAELRKAKGDLTKEKELKGVWAAIEKVNANVVAYDGIHRFDKLSDVVKRVKSPLPKVVYTHGNLAGREKTNFQSLDHVVKNLTSRPDRFLDRGKHTAVWQELSKLYVNNARGEIAIWEGRKKNYKQVDAGRALINTEIKELLKKKAVPPETLKKVVALAKRHEGYYRQQMTDFEKHIKEAERKIKAASKA